MPPPPSAPPPRPWTLPAAGPIVIVVAIIFSAIYLGWATPTEAGAAGSFLALAISVVQGRLTLKLLLAAVNDTIRVSDGLANLENLEAIDAGAGWNQIVGTGEDDHLDFSAEGAPRLANIDRISGGRLAVNVVNGWWKEEFDLFSGGAWLGDQDQRYRRMDEAGTPWCLTVDGETLEHDERQHEGHADAETFAEAGSAPVRLLAVGGGTEDLDALEGRALMARD